MLLLAVPLDMAALTNAVVANWDELVPEIAVGANGTPVNIGDNNGAVKTSALASVFVFTFKSNAAWVALEIGFSKSSVLSTLLNPISDFVILIDPVSPFTDWTGDAGFNNSIQLDNTAGLEVAKTKFLFKSVLITTVPRTAELKANISAWLETTFKLEKEISGIWLLGILPKASRVATPLATPNLFISNFEFKAFCVAVETVLFISDVLSTALNPMSDFVILTVPVYPFTDWTGDPEVNNSTQCDKIAGPAVANTKFLFKSVLIAILPTDAEVKANIAASLPTTLVEDIVTGGNWLDGIIPKAFKLATPLAIPNRLVFNLRLIRFDK